MAKKRGNIAFHSIFSPTVPEEAFESIAARRLTLPQNRCLPTDVVVLMCSTDADHRGGLRDARQLRQPTEIAVVAVQVEQLAVTVAVPGRVDGPISQLHEAWPSWSAVLVSGGP